MADTPTEKKDLNIKSSTIEKGLDLVKDLLEKLVSPALEETGQMIADKIRFIRWKQQISILQKAKDYIAANNIQVKSIPTKILVPLLENASLEEDEEMQNKWAKMIVNLADSEKNLQSQIFPSILSQLSLNEYNALKLVYDQEVSLVERCGGDIHRPEYFNPKIAANINVVLARLNTNPIVGYRLQLKDNYEIDNLLRLRLVKLLPPRLKVENRDVRPTYDNHKTDVHVSYENLANYRITDLGISFISICELHTSE